MKSLIRVASAAAVVVASALLVTGVASARVQPHTASPQVVVTPSTGLTNGETVQVSGSGFTPGDSVFILQCLATATGSSGCAIAGAVPATISSTGALAATPFPVATGTIGSGGTCGTSASDASACVIAVANLSGSDRGVAPITFAVSTTTTTAPAGPAITVTPSTGLTNGESVSVSGSGFTPGDSVYVIECSATATTEAGCNITGASGPVTIDAQGNLPATSYNVSTGQMGTAGTCGTSSTNLNGCVVVVANLTGSDRGVAPITFALAAPTTTTTMPAPRAPRHAWAVPAANLRNGQVVHIHGQGFAPREHLYLVECRHGATRPAQCDLHTLRAVTVSAKGTFAATPFIVRTGRIGGALCGTAAANLRGCEISIANASRGDRFIIPISFRKP